MMIYTQVRFKPKKKRNRHPKKPHADEETKDAKPVYQDKVYQDKSQSQDGQKQMQFKPKDH